MRFIAVINFFLISILLSACISNHSNSTPAPYLSSHKTVYISNLFSESEVEIIRLALTQFECNTEHKVVQYIILDNSKPINWLFTSPKYSLLIQKSLSSDPRVINADLYLPKGEYTVGLYIPNEDIPTILAVDDRINDDQTFNKVIKHEILHQYLWEHSSKSDSILYPRIDKAADDFTEYDLYRLRLQLNFGNKDFHLCKKGEL